MRASSTFRGTRRVGSMASSSRLWPPIWCEPPTRARIDLKTLARLVDLGPYAGDTTAACFWLSSAAGVANAGWQVPGPALPPLAEASTLLPKVTKPAMTELDHRTTSSPRPVGQLAVLMMMKAHQSRSTDPRLTQSINEKEMTQNAIHRSVSEIDSELTDSAFSFLLFCSSLSVLSSLLRLLFSACFKTLLFFLPSSFSVCFLKSSSFLFFFFLTFSTTFWDSSLFFLFLWVSSVSLFSLTSLNSIFFVAKFFCCCLSVIFQHLLRVIGMRKLLNHPVTIIFAWFGPPLFPFCPPLISFMRVRISSSLIFHS